MNMHNIEEIDRKKWNTDRIDIIGRLRKKDRENKRQDMNDIVTEESDRQKKE